MWFISLLIFGILIYFIVRAVSYEPPKKSPNRKVQSETIVSRPVSTPARPARPANIAPVTDPHERILESLGIHYLYHMTHRSSQLKFEYPDSR